MLKNRLYLLCLLCSLLSLPLSATGNNAREPLCFVTTHGSPVKERRVDLVSDVCVFDSCFATFMSVSHLIRSERNVADDMREDFINIGRALRYGLRASVSEMPLVRIQADSEMKSLRRVQRDLYASGSFDEAAERRKLAAQLRAFGDTADYVPLVYATIHTEYGGDITRYVDDLFRRSAMTNRRRMMRVTRWPRKKRLQSDMGFQLSLSKQLYRAWEQMDRPTQLIGHFVIPNQWKK